MEFVLGNSVKSACQLVKASYHQRLGGVGVGDRDLENVADLSISSRIERVILRSGNIVCAAEGHSLTSHSTEAQWRLCFSFALETTDLVQDRSCSYRRKCYQ